MLVGLKTRRNAENFLRRARVDILVARKSFDQQRVFGHVRQDPKLDLRVVGG